MAFKGWKVTHSPTRHVTIIAGKSGSRSHNSNNWERRAIIIQGGMCPIRTDKERLFESLELCYDGHSGPYWYTRGGSPSETSVIVRRFGVPLQVPDVVTRGRSMEMMDLTLAPPPGYQTLSHHITRKTSSRRNPVSNHIFLCRWPKWNRTRCSVRLM